MQLQQFVGQEHQLSFAWRRQTVQFIDYSQSIWTPFIVYLPFISGLYLLRWTHITWCYELLRATMGHYGKNGRPRDASASFNKWTDGTGPHSHKSTAHWVVLIREGCTKKTGKSLVFCQRGGGEVSEGSKMPNLYFGVLKRVKNGLKMAKKHIEILYFS